MQKRYASHMTHTFSCIFLFTGNTRFFNTFYKLFLQNNRLVIYVCLLCFLKCVKSVFYFVNSKKSSIFAPESSTPGFRGWEMSPSRKANLFDKDPSRGFQDILKRRLLALCSDIMKLRNFQILIRT